MRFFSLSLLLLAACSTTESSSSSSSSSSSGDPGSSSGTPGSSGNPAGTGGTFWFIAGSNKTVGASNFSAAETFAETLTATPKDIAVGGGSAWVVTDDGKLLRYDLAAPKRVASVDVGKNLSHVVYAAGAVWVSDDNDDSACTDIDNGNAKVIRIDPATNAVVKSLSVTATTTFPCNRFDALTTDGTAVFALVDNAFGVARIDPATNTVTKRAALGEGEGYGVGNMTSTASTLWVANTNGHFVFALDPTTLDQKSKTPSADVPGKFLASLFVATDDAVYVGGIDKAVLRIDAKNPTAQVEKAFPESPDWLAVSGNTVYGAASPSLDSLMIGADGTTFAETSRVSLAYVYGFSKFVFVP